MRIIAGEFGGRRILAPPGSTTRPTSERAREAVFSSLGSLEGLAALDLFAGSGAMGLEALSRGASSVTFAERSRSASAAILRNVASLGVGGRCRLVTRGWEHALAADEAAEIRYDVVFLDPPYGDWRALQDRLGASLQPLLAPGARVVAEHRAGEAPSLVHMQVERSRSYGDTGITMLAPEPSAEQR